MKAFFLCVQLLRSLPLLPFVSWSEPKFRMDLERWQQLLHIPGKPWAAFARLMWEKREFRNLFLYRVRFRRVFRTWVKLWYRPMESLCIEAGDIGGGLFIQHGIATVIAAKAMGENCWVNQQVTIGFKDSENPVIGSDVMITCGAKVLGGITVGDGAVIGANAVVVRDVEPGATMVGIPAKRIR